MYIKKCKFCDYQIEVKRDNNSIISLHENRCNNNPNRIDTSSSLKGIKKVNRITIVRNCIKCGKEFQISGTQKQLDSPKSKKCCSRFCANSKDHSDETKNKISNSIKTTILSLKNNNKINKVKQYNHIKDCLYCNKIFFTNKFKQEYCSRFCCRKHIKDSTKEKLSLMAKEKVKNGTHKG